jgi:hypothetical protein
MSQALSRPYSQIVGMTGIEAYAVDAAVVRWGTAFKAAIEAAGAEAKNKGEAERKTQTVIRRWLPSARQYR